jgi:hypothetical protein
MIWKAFFLCHDNDDYSPPIFKSKKSNLSNNYKIPEELKAFLSAIKSELMDPRIEIRQNAIFQRN